MTKEEIIGVTLEGWCVIEDTIVGKSLWLSIDTTGEEDVLWPDIYQDRELARKAIIQNYVEKLDDYLAGDREWDEIDMEIQEYVGVCRIEENQLIVHDEDGNLLIDMDINTWRAQL